MGRAAALGRLARGLRLRGPRGQIHHPLLQGREASVRLTEAPREAALSRWPGEAAGPGPAPRPSPAASTHLAVSAGDAGGAGAAIGGLSSWSRGLRAGLRARGAHAPVPTGLRGARPRRGQGRGGHRGGQAAAAGPRAEQQQQQQQGGRGQQLRTGRRGAAGRHGRPSGRWSWSRNWGAVAAGAAAVTATAAPLGLLPPAAAGTVVPGATTGGACGAGQEGAGQTGTRLWARAGGGGKGRGDPSPTASSGRSRKAPLGPPGVRVRSESWVCPKEPRRGSGGFWGPGRELGGAREGKGLKGSMPAEGKMVPGLQVRSSGAHPTGGAGAGGCAAQRREGRLRLAAATRCLLAQNL